jgi:UDP-glucose 4-epimerase
MTTFPKCVLVTGGSGYIGSHTCVELLNAGSDVIVVDNLSNSRREAVAAIEQVTGRQLALHTIDLRNAEALGRIFSRFKIDAVMHFAGLKAVGESVAQALTYYDNNVGGTLALINCMKNAGVRTFVFSSSATVYGEPKKVPIDESHRLAPASPYGRTKLMVEEILRDVHRSDPDWRVAVLRYFNPVGAHMSGDLGEDPSGVPNNLMPLVSQVAVGRRRHLTIHGDDYPTPDGTGVRDYVHVVDLARGHLKALEALAESPAYLTCNLGTGRGYSVLEVIRTFEAESGRRIEYRMGPRRPGDVASYYADPSLANDRLHWTAELDLAAMCRDAWRWQSRHPDGYSRADAERALAHAHQGAVPAGRLD